MKKKASRKKIDAVVDLIIDHYGSVKAVQKKFGYTEPMGVYNWRSRGIPSTHLLQLHVETGIPAKTLKSVCSG